MWSRLYRRRTRRPGRRSPRGSHHSGRTDLAPLGCTQNAIKRPAGFEGPGVLKMLELQPDLSSSGPSYPR